MKKFIFFVALFPIILTANLGFSEDFCQNITIQELEKHLPGPLPPNSKILLNKEKEGICESIIDVNGREIPFYSTKNFVIIGQMFKDKKNLSYEAISTIRKSYLSKLKDKIDSAVTYSLMPDKIRPEHTIYFFTDPLCPYCHRTVQRIKNFSNKTNTNVKIILYSVHGDKGNKEIEKVICSNMDFETYASTNFPLQKKSTTCEKGQKVIKLGQEIARKLKINAVPAFVLEDGTQVIGADLRRLELALSQTSNSTK